MHIQAEGGCLVAVRDDVGGADQVGAVVSLVVDQVGVVVGLVADRVGAVVSLVVDHVGAVVGLVDLVWTLLSLVGLDRLLT